MAFLLLEERSLRQTSSTLDPAQDIWQESVMSVKLISPLNEGVLRLFAIVFEPGDLGNV